MFYCFWDKEEKKIKIEIWVNIDIWGVDVENIVNEGDFYIDDIESNLGNYSVINFKGVLGKGEGLKVLGVVERLSEIKVKEYLVGCI